MQIIKKCRKKKRKEFYVATLCLLQVMKDVYHEVHSEKEDQEPAYYISSWPKMLEPFHQNVRPKNQKV